MLTVVTTLAVKNFDEDHPYEFGFTIDGQQHRHEKKGKILRHTKKLKFVKKLTGTISTVSSFALLLLIYLEK